MVYKDKNRQKQANKEAQVRFKAKAKGITDQGITQTEEVIPQTIIDACGTEHSIDFKGRCKDYELLKSWADGEGSVYQQRLGVLGRQYSTIKGYLDEAGELTEQGQNYLGRSPQAVPQPIGGHK